MEDENITCPRAGVRTHAVAGAVKFFSSTIGPMFECGFKAGIVLRPKGIYQPEYMSFAICQEPEQMLKCVTGGLIKHISAKSIAGVSIPIPTLEAQRSFVDMANSAESTKAGLKKSIAGVEAMMRALINNEES